MKIIRKSNFRVIVEPKSLGDFGSIRISDSFFYNDEEKREKEYHSKCREIADQIKRHVDEVRNVDVYFDTDELCSLCGLSWELDETGSPLCCEAAFKEYKQSKQKLA